MIFYCDLQGNLKAFQNETVYQGSNNVTTIYVVAPFSRPVGLNISFTKPNKLVTSPAIMKWVGTLGNVKIPVSFVNIPEQFTDTYNVWAYALPYSITEQNGVVGVSVNAVIADSVDASGQQAYKGNLTTFTGQFTVAYSALPSPPTDIPTEWTQDKVLDLLNNYYNDAIQKIGEMNTLKTNAKDTLVKAINEVFDEIAATNATIGNLSTLTTDEKGTIVGAINEVDAHANTAQQTADNATVLANTGISKAEQAQATANGAVATANEAKTTAQTAETNANSAVDTANAANTTAGEAKAIAQGSQRAIGFATLKAAITALNGYSNTQLKVGDNVYIVETGVPDLWVAAVEQNSVAYNYTTNDAFNDDLVENTLVQVGYYKFAYLESDGKPCTVAWQNMTVAESDWVASTEFADFAYEAKIILTDFVNFSSIPQVVFGLTEATSGNYAPICKAGDKGVYIYSKVNTAITLPTVVTFAPNVHGASMQGGGYTNKGKWVASTTYAIDDLVYTDNGQYVCIEGITSTTSPEQDTQHWQATFVATGKTKNGLTISGQDNGTQVQKTFDGSTAVEIAFDETTMTAKEVNGVLKVGAKGTVPEALPATGAKITGNLPTSGWAVNAIPLWEGDYYTTSYQGEFLILPAGSINFDLALKADRSKWFINIDGGYDTPAKINTDENTYISFYRYSSQSLRYTINQDGSLYGNASGNARYHFYGIKNAEYGDIVYTISDTAIKTNSTVSMYLNSADEVRAYSKADGSVVVEMDSVPTSAIPYTLQVVETSAEGAFEIVNSYLPTIPETPTALPQTAGALKSGEMTTSGWAATENKELYNGKLSFAGYQYSPSNNGKILSPYNYTSKNALQDWSGTIIDGTSIDHCTIRTDDEGVQYVSLYWNSGAPSHKNREIQIYNDGTVKAWTYADRSTTYDVKIVATFLSDYAYTISDADVTTNSDILMEITDANHIVPAPIESGKIKVISDTVPTSPIPYTYKVKQTNASGQFTLLNHYVPKVEIPTIPTKTSELINDSGFVSNLPTVQNVVCNDVDSATTLDTTIPCEIGDLILAQIIVRSALTLPTGWSLLRTIPAVETSTNQTLSFAYKKATSTSETLTVTQASAGRIYTNLVRLSNAVSISYIQSCEKTNTGVVSISSTKPVTPNMVIWGASSTLWNSSSPYGNWSSSPSTLDYYSLPQATKAPRLGTFVDSNGAGERTFTAMFSPESSAALMCGAVEIVGDEVARKGDIPTATTLYEDSTGAATVTLSETINNGDIVRIKTNNGNVDHYYIGVAWNRTIAVTESLMVTDESDVTVGTAININSLRFNIQDTSLILFHYFKTNITTAGAVTITNEKANVVIRKVERIHT